MSEGQEFMSMWTIYNRPADYPGHYVVRRHAILRGRSEPTGDFSIHLTLQDARSQGIPPGLYCLPRSPEDDPVIVETWF
jgi:hypothetical protein